MLSERRQDQVNAAVAALDNARTPIPPNLFPALAEPALRRVVKDVLAASGRVLITHPNGLISGYDDTVAARLAEEGLGILPATDRAVLAIILIFSVAIPRAEGELPPEAPWTNGRPVPDEKFDGIAIRAGQVRDTLQRLTDADLVRVIPGKGRVLGAQFHRLTPQATSFLFEQLVLLADPYGSLADSIKRRRTQQYRTTSQEASL
ncbi:hypothetical protein [Sphaerisporangium sp. NPDC051011]|uniref:hypothetical protein n=1 Tax=Sphaerisporangium sp. NPDC051011 TaxID=3155792 RepID=UPI0033E1E1D1